jgi:hypothetical protein
MHDALTGDIIWGRVYDGDADRAMTASIDPEELGEQSWSKAVMGTVNGDGEILSETAVPSHQLMAAWFDGDTGREMIDGTGLYKQVLTGTAPNKTVQTTKSFTFPGVRSAASKGQPIVIADILGDWREEIVFGTSNNTALRVFTTTSRTEREGAGAVPETGIPSLLQDPMYRAAVAWQNGGYQQPTHPGFYLGYRMNELGDVPRLNIKYITFDPNGGSFANGNLEDIEKPRKLAANASIFDSSLVKVSREGHSFAGWYLGDQLVDANTPITADVTLRAEWETGGQKASLSLNGDAGALQGEDVKYLVSVSDAARFATATVWFEVEDAYFTGKEFKGLNGFEMIGGVQWTQDGGKWIGRATLANYDGGVDVTAAQDLFEMIFTAKDAIGTTEVKLTRVELSGYGAENEAVFIGSKISNGAVSTMIGESFDVCDVNRDKRVDQLDLTAAQLYYRNTEEDANWDIAKKADVNNDGRVDIEDFVLILNSIIW